MVLIILSHFAWAQHDVNFDYSSNGIEEVKIVYPGKDIGLEKAFQDYVDKAFNNKPAKSSVLSIVAPEDGSITTAKWFFNTKDREEDCGFSAQDIADVLKNTGVTPVHVDLGLLGYTQDQMLFDIDGRFKLQPPTYFPPAKTLPYICDAGIMIIDEQNVAKISDGQHQMRSLFIEGGAMITGRFVPQDPSTTYAILNNDLLENMPYIEYCQNTTYEQYQKDIKGKDEAAFCKNMLTREQIIEKAAVDLGISKELLVIVDIPHHLDMRLFALPGGKIIVNDHNMVIQLLTDNNLLHGEYTIQDAAVKDQQKIKEALLSFNAKSKKYKFTIIPAAGKFDIVWSEKDSANEFLNRKFYANFFNGVNLKTPSSERIVLTNKAEMVTYYGKSLEESRATAERLLPLEKYWANLLARHDNIKPENVKFIGLVHGGGGAGINCRGAVCPQ